MIEDEFPAKELVNRTDDEERIRRVMRVNDVQTLSDADVQADHEARARKVPVLGDIANEHAKLVQNRLEAGRPRARKLFEQGQAWNTVDRDAANVFARRFMFAAKRDDRYSETVFDERGGLIANPRVRGKAILHQHQDSTSRFLHTVPSVRTTGPRRLPGR